MGGLPPPTPPSVSAGAKTKGGEFKTLKQFPLARKPREERS